MATTLYINSSDLAIHTEAVSAGIGWTFVADSILLEEWIDILIGETRKITVSSVVTVADSATLLRPDVANFSGNVPPRRGEASGYYLANGSQFNYIPVRTAEIFGGGILEELIPTRELTAVVSSDWPAVLNKRVPVRTLVAYLGGTQDNGLIPTRTIDAEIYTGGLSSSGYIPVRSVVASESIILYVVFAGNIPIRSLVSSGYESGTCSLDKKRTVWFGQADIVSDYGSTFTGVIPPRKISSDEYEAGISVEGNIPVRYSGASVGTGGTSGESGTATPTVTTDYILRYVRP